MSKLRINNATLFVTVLSACLGLVAAGASSHARPSASCALSEITSATSANLQYGCASVQAHKRAPVYMSRTPLVAFHSAAEAPQVLYKNRNPLTSRSQILVVTRMPRASIEALPA
ncbi:MAG: hypothetical protein LC731_01260 [Acidobacteria bacterium]|nr:hypothetical protein [Acidobacteriota bacterium]